MKTHEKPFGYLNTVRILDFADARASFCTRLLADLGARVIKVEKPGGDSARRAGPHFRGLDNARHSLSFLYNNTNKYGITLNLDRAKGRSLFIDLIKKSDVLVETFSPGYLAGVGLDYGHLSMVNPELIHASISNFGPDGPKKAYKSCDLVAAASGGQMAVNGSPDREPLKIYGDQSGFSASLFGVYGILMALRNRRLTGEGEHLDISLQASVTATLEHVLGRYFAGKTIFKRQAGRHWNDEFVILPCRDGFMAITVFQHWDTLVEWLEADGMAADLKEDMWRDEQYRRSRSDHVISILQKWTLAHSVAELFETAQLMRFPWAPVRSPGEVLDCPQHKAREFFVETDHLESGMRLCFPGMPFRSGHTPRCPARTAPLPGEHNRQIYAQELGIPATDLEKLYHQKTI